MAKLSANTAQLREILEKMTNFSGGASSSEIAEYERLIEEQRVIIEELARELASKAESPAEDLTEELTALQTEIEEQQSLIQQLTEALVLHGGGSSSTPTLVSFTLDGVTYQAREGSCWGEWIYSDYNPHKSETNSSMGGFYIPTDSIKVLYYYVMGLSGEVQLNSVTVKPLDLIVANASYTYYVNSGSDGPPPY